MNIAMYLAEDIMAFWRKSGKVHTQNGGWYLGLIQRLEKSDPVMQDHYSRILKAEFTYHYGIGTSNLWN